MTDSEQNTASGEQTPIEDEQTDSGPRVGIIPREELSNEDYHRSPGISKSGIMKVAQSGLHYITEKQNPKPSTPTMEFGTTYHHLILEPDTFFDVYAIEPANAPKRPTVLQANPKKGDPKPEHAAAAEFWAEFDSESAGKKIVSTKCDPSKGIWGRSDWDNLRYMRDTLLDPIKHPNICLALAPHMLNEWDADDDEDTTAGRRMELSGGPSEVSAYVVDKNAPYVGGIKYDPTFKLMKCRLDKLNTDHNVAVDLKTAVDASYSGFARAVVQFDYHVQHAMYMDIWRQLGKPLDGFLFVPQEKIPPYAPAIYELPKRAVEFGAALYRQYLEQYAKCHKDNEWPGYNQDIRPLELPGYAYRADIS
jgi:hypothetical protein